jgi:hypothetical protein
MKTKGLWMTAGLAIAVLVITLLFLVVPGNVIQAESRSVVGSWWVTVKTDIQGTTFPSTMTFISDGNLLADETPYLYETTGHGDWIYTSKNDVAYTFEVIIGDENGALATKAKVSGTLHYYSQKDSWKGPFSILVFDPDGNQVFADTGTMEGARIKVWATHVASFIAFSGSSRNASCLA